MKFVAARTSASWLGHIDNRPIQFAEFTPGIDPEYGEWNIEINTLEELIEVIRKNVGSGQAVITVGKPGELPTLEIYDAYRE